MIPIWWNLVWDASGMIPKNDLGIIIIIIIIIIITLFLVEEKN